MTITFLTLQSRDACKTLTVPIPFIVNASTGLYQHDFTSFSAAAWTRYSTPSNASLSLSMSLMSPINNLNLSSLSSSFRSLSWSCHLRLIPTRREMLYSGFNSSLDSAVPRLPVMPVIPTHAPRQKMLFMFTSSAIVQNCFQGRATDSKRGGLCKTVPLLVGIV